MAHANIHLNAITRSGGKSAVGASAYRSAKAITSSSVVAAAAYRSGECLQDQRDNVDKKTYDYTRKQNVLASAMLTPDHAPDWAKDRQNYWNAVEAREKRKDALLAKEAVLVLPRDLSVEQQKEVVETWAIKNLVKERGLVVDYAIHSPEASDGGRNPHAHVMYYPRAIDEEGKWGKKLTGYLTPGTVDGTKALKKLRASYQDELNAAANSANDNKQKVYDLRSYRERGVNKIPQPKKGKIVTWLEKKGFMTTRQQEVDRVMALNEAKKDREKFVKKSTASCNKAYKKRMLKQAWIKTRKMEREMAKNERTHGYRRHVKTTRKGRYNSIVGRARQDIANSYYDIMYGNGTAGSYERTTSFER